MTRRLRSRHLPLAVAVLPLLVAVLPAERVPAASPERFGTAWAPTVGLAVVIDKTLEILRSGTARPIATGAGISVLSWSPDGRQLAFERTTGSGASLWRVGADGTGLRQIASTRDGTLTFCWAASGDVLDVASSTPLAKRTVVSTVDTSGHSSALATVPGDVESLAADSSELAISTATFGSAGFTTGTLELVTPAGTVRTLATSRNNAFEALGFSPDETKLLYRVDPSNSSSIAADGLDFRSDALLTGATRDLGVGLTDPRWQSWAPTGATLAITLGGSRAAWATDKHVAICALRSGVCASLAEPAGLISFAPAFGAGGRLAYVTARGLGGSDGFGKGAPFGSSSAPADRWNATFRIWVATTHGTAEELGGLGAADAPEWVAGGPGLLVERSGALWYLASVHARPARVTPAFLALGFGYYGDHLWSSEFALAPH